MGSRSFYPLVGNVLWADGVAQTCVFRVGGGTTAVVNGLGAGGSAAPPARWRVFLGPSPDPALPCPRASASHTVGEKTGAPLPGQGTPTLWVLGSCSLVLAAASPLPCDTSGDAPGEEGGRRKLQPSRPRHGPPPRQHSLPVGGRAPP